MKNLLDKIYRSTLFVVLVVIALILFHGLLKYNHEKKEIDKELERIVQGSLSQWFHGMSLQHIDGKEGFYIVGDKIDDEIMVYVEKWNNEGITAFVDLEELAESSTVSAYWSKSEDELRAILVDEINKKILDEEENKAMRFMVRGWKARDTRYKSVLEIEGILFMTCADKLSDLISGVMEGTQVSLRYEWIDTLRGK